MDVTIRVIAHGMKNTTFAPTLKEAKKSMFQSKTLDIHPS